MVVVVLMVRVKVVILMVVVEVVVLMVMVEVVVLMAVVDVVGEGGWCCLLTVVFESQAYCQPT